MIYTHLYVHNKSDIEVKNVVLSYLYSSMKHVGRASGNGMRLSNHKRMT